MLTIQVVCITFPMILLVSGQNSYIISPNVTTNQCADQLEDAPCLTLVQYLQRHPHQSISNTIIRFLPGNHTVSENEYLSWFIVQDAANISLIGENSNIQVNIMCKGKLGFIFDTVSNMSISNLVFHECGLKIPHFNFPNAALYFAYVSSLVLQNIGVYKSYGYGVLGVNVVGNSFVRNSKFHFNNWHVDHCTGGENTQACRGGNVLFFYAEYHYTHAYSQNLTLENTSLEYGFAGTVEVPIAESGIDYGGVGGLGFLLEMSSFTIAINISNVQMAHNFHPSGSNLFIVVQAGSKTPSNVVHIEKCTFNHGGYHVPSSSTALQGGGVTIVEYWINPISAAVQSTIQLNRTMIRIQHSNISDNVAQYGGGLFFVRSTETQFTPIETGVATHLKLDSCLFSNNMASEGGSIIYAKPYIGFFSGPTGASPLIESGCYDSNFRSEWIVNISSCVFENNVVSGLGGLFFSNYPSNLATSKYKISQHVLVSNCTFAANEGELGTVLYINPSRRIVIHIENSQFHSNAVRPWEPTAEINTLQGSVVYVDGCERCLVVSDSTFENNFETVLSVSNSKIIMHGNVLIINNANDNGAITLNSQQKQSLLYFGPNTHLNITNNTSTSQGGGIQVKSVLPYNSELCFFQFTGALNASVTMQNNTAIIAGDSIYSSASFEYCMLVPIDPGTQVHQVQRLTMDVFYNFFHILPPHSLSEVASNPYKVCMCHGGVPDCNDREVSVSSHYPGESFNISAIAVGQFNGSAPAIVQSVINPDYNATLAPGESFQHLSRECTNVTLSVHMVENSTVHIGLFTKKGLGNFFVSIGLLTQASMNNGTLELIALKDSEEFLDVEVPIRDCPIAFEVSGILPKCDCSLYLRNNGITSCSINNQSLHRPAEKWIGLMNKHGIGIAIHSHCPLDYCKPEDNNIQLSQPDEQCVPGHSGILCGECSPGLSLALGTSNCMKCSNIYLLLLAPFALAGVVLVSLLLKCNLTVSEGGLNGLIFYANILGVNHTIYFTATTSNLYMRILAVFIAWLNLDLGIETCFYNGLDAYVKTWLQFVFPVYIWLLAGLMVVLSWYSSLGRRLIGSNAVHVLATLFLLAYAKLLRTIINIISFTILTDEQGTSEIVWLIDGNIPFLGGKHSILFAMAVLATILYVIPFTLLVLFAPCLQARSHLWALRWVNKLKPLLDAYMGPYKDKFRSWPGLMLLLRIVLFIIFASNVVGDPGVNLLVTGTTVVLLLTYWGHFGMVYKSRFPNVLESFFILNLGILVLATNFVHSLDRFQLQGQLIVTCILVSGTLLASIAILLFHFYKQIKKQQFQCCKKQHAYSSVPQDDPSGDECVTPPDVHQPTVTIIDMNELRESLLSDDHDNPRNH